MLRREGEKEVLKVELKREMAVKLREQKEQIRSFMQVQLQQMAKMRDEKVSNEEWLCQSLGKKV